MNIVLLCFGNETAFHIQTYFAILTVLKHKDKDDTVTVYTDFPDHYRRLEPMIRIAVFDKPTLDGWMKGTGYIFRAKIKAIEESARNNPDSHLLFLDGDVCLFAGLDGIRDLLDNGCGVMYTDEGHPSRMKGRSLKMWKAVEGAAIGGGASCVSMKHNVWNSGVIGIPKDRLDKVIHMALDVCDMILERDGRCFTAEQYAFSIAMVEMCEVRPATQWVGHYWGNKNGWLSQIYDYLLMSHVCGWTLGGEILNLDTDSFMKIPLRVKKSNTGRRLKNLIDRMFPDKISSI